MKRKVGEKMNKMKKITAILIILALCFAVAACGGDGETTSSGGTTNSGGTTSSGGTSSSGSGSGDNVLVPGDVISAPEEDNVEYADLIDIILQSIFTVIDPLNPAATNPGFRFMYICLYDRLVYRTNEGEFVGELATSWETDDLQHYTFHLREGVVFHNGENFTAQSVIDTITTARENPGSLAFDAWRSVDTITAVNDYTLDIVLTAPNVDFIFQMSIPGASIISRAERAIDPVAGAWVGTGAYYMEDFVPGDYALLTRNDNYWGAPIPTRQLLFRFVPEFGTRAVYLQNGQSHICTGLSTADIDMFVDDPNFIVYRIPSDPHPIAFNMNDPITGDLNFRLAVAHALNMDEITIVAAGNYGSPSTDGTFWGYSTEFRNTAVPLLEYNVDLAREYLEASSYNGEEVEIMTGVETTQRAAEIIQEQLGRIGIRITLLHTDSPTLSAAAVYGNTQTQLVSHPSPFSLSASSARPMFYPGGASNRASYNNPAVTELFDLAPTIGDPAQRESIYKEIQELISADLPYLNIFYRVQAIVTTSNIGGIITNADQNHDFRGIFMVVD